MTARALLGRAWPSVALLLIFLLPGFPAMAQQVAFKSYGADRGLFNLGISCLKQDRIGFLLACTDNGIFRFDGQNFLRYGVANGLPERGISDDLQVAPNGAVFVVVSGMLFGAADDKMPLFAPIPGPHHIDSEGGASTALVGNDLLLAAAGQLWIASVNSAGRTTARPLLSDTLLHRFPALNAITSMAAVGDTLWLGCGNGRLCRLNCVRQLLGSAAAECRDVHVFESPDGVPAQDWVSMLVDRNGTVWARSADNILSLHRGDSQITVDRLPGGVGRYAGRTYRLAIAEGPDGRLVTQGPSGLLVRDNEQWSEIDRTHGLTDGEIAAILFDREGSLWLGLRGQGLFRAVGSGEWENWTTSDGLRDNVCWELAKHGSSPLWVATERGVDAIAPADRDVMTHPPLDGPTYALATTQTGRVWAADLSGQLRRYSPGDGRIDATLGIATAYQMATDRAGDLLLATHDGMWRVPDPDALSPSAPALVPGTRGRIRVFAEDADGFLWMVVDNALMRIDPAGRQAPVVELRDFVRMPRAMLFVKPDELWLGSDEGGLEQVILSRGKPAHLATIDHPSLAASQIMGFARDTRGWIWISSDRGLDVWNGREWRRLDQEDGLLSNDLNEGSILADPDGSMWFGTGHGLSHLLNASDVFNVGNLHPVISQVLLNGAPLTSTSIPWSQARLTISFSDLDFRFDDTVRFRYRLAGVDRDWVETRDTTVRYPTLPSGRLVFSVQAIDPVHHRTSDPVSFTLEVRPPWWATYWFRVLTTITALAAVTAVWRLRIRLLVLQRRQLEELVAVRTAEIADAHAALKIQASRDGLTGLLNRAAITEELDNLLCDPVSRRRLAVAVVDLDHFKAINDQYGHFGGDAVLRQVSARLMGALAPGEFAGRYGGEEFVLLLSGPGSAAERLHQLRTAMLAGPVRLDDAEIAVSGSFGLAQFRLGDSGETLLRRADQLLYQAKENGRDRIVCG